MKRLLTTGPRYPEYVPLKCSVRLNEPSVSRGPRRREQRFGSMILGQTGNDDAEPRRPVPSAPARVSPLVANSADAALCTTGGRH